MEKLISMVKCGLTQLQKYWNNPATRLPIVVFLILRVGLSLWMWGVNQIYDVSLEPDPILRPYLGVKQEQNPILEPWQRWDTLHYQAIAERGYGAFNSALFVPPLYPLLIRGVSIIINKSTLLAGMIISNIAFIMSLSILYRLTFYEFGDQNLAKRSMNYMAFLPTAFFFLAAYTESIFLLAALLATYLARKRKWYQAGFWGAVAAFVRLPGLIICIPLLYETWNMWKSKRDWNVWAAVGIPLVGGAIFPVYIILNLKLLPWTPLVVQSDRFHGGLSFPGMNIISAFNQVVSGNYPLTNVFDLSFSIIFLVILLAVWRMLPRMYENLLPFFRHSLPGTYGRRISSYWDDTLRVSAVPGIYRTWNMGSKSIGQSGNTLHILVRIIILFRTVCDLGLGRVKQRNKRWLKYD